PISTVCSVDYRSRWCGAGATRHPLHLVETVEREEVQVPSVVRLLPPPLRLSRRRHPRENWIIPSFWMRKAGRRGGSSMKRLARSGVLRARNRRAMAIGRGRDAYPTSDLPYRRGLR
ncbi:hypothetical protein PENTCL1PPCAC_21216, partial [Pristionchus entomophagus]